MEDEQGLMKEAWEQDRDHCDRKQGHNQLSRKSSRLACGSLLNKRGLDRAVKLYRGKDPRASGQSSPVGMGPVALNLQVPGWPHV